MPVSADETSSDRSVGSNFALAWTLASQREGQAGASSAPEESPTTDRLRIKGLPEIPDLVFHAVTP